MRLPNYFVAAFITITLPSCVDTPGYDVSPDIEFVGIDVFDTKDSLNNDIKQARITLSFRDGDGDLGDDVQSSERNSFYTANGGWGNYHIQTLKLVSDKWETHFMSELELPLIFPILKTDRTAGPISGKLDFDINLSAGKGARETPLKFVVKVRDRQLRESNAIETDVVTLPIFDDQ